MIHEYLQKLYKRNFQQRAEKKVSDEKIMRLCNELRAKI